MELSRLSNSLGSVCSQRRGRLAAGAGRPRLPHFLSHHSPPIPPLPPPESQEHFLCVFLSHCANGRTPPADPRGCCAPLSRTSLYAPTLARSSLGCHSQPWSTKTMALCQRDFGFQPLLAASPRCPNPPNLRSETAFGMKPSEGAHYFTSCLVRHSPKHLDLTGSHRVEPATFQTGEFNSKFNQIKAVIYIFVFGNKRRKRVVLLGTNNTDLLNWSVIPRNPKYVDLGSCQMFFSTAGKKFSGFKSSGTVWSSHNST